MRVGLGTWVTIEASAPLPGQAAAAMEAAFDAIREIEDRMHPTRSGSDLARINADVAMTSRTSTSPFRAAFRSLPVHPTTWSLLEFAQHLFELTEGVFDPCLPCRPGRLCDIELGSGGWVLCHAPVKLDFGGFAKGYAIDRAIEALLEHGCTSGLVNAGGDLRVFGTQPRTILLREPGGLLRPVELRGQALAMSHLQAQDRPREHQGYYRRGGCAQNSTEPYASVVASEALKADALTKCVLLCSPEIASRALSKLGGTDIGQRR